MHSLRSHMSQPRTRTIRKAGLAGYGVLACALAIALPAGAQSRSNDALVQDLLRRIEALERRLGEAPPAAGASAAAIENRLQALEVQSTETVALAREAEVSAKQAVASAKSSDAPKVTLEASKGLGFKAGALEVKLRGLVQGDGRFFIDDDGAYNDGFLFRRVRPTLEGSWGELIGFRLTPEFAGDSATLVDAYVDLKFDPRATVRIGKVKGPIGLERLQGGGATAFIERGFPTELAPNRDLGVQLQGAFSDARVAYTVGVYNGTADGRDGPSTNPDNDFEWAGRLFLEPWKGSDSALAGLGFGVAGSIGDKRGSGNAFLPRYRSQGQNPFFNYRSAVLADGEHSRWSPQGYYYHGAFGVLAEYIRSSQELREPVSGTRGAFDNQAWQLVASYVLTGEKAGYRGVTRPNQPFTVGGAGWGAFELAARYGRLEVDEDAFPVFADPNAVSDSARSWGLGLNWYLNENLKLVTNYTHTRFGAAVGGAPRDEEKTLFTRAQFSF